MFMKHLAELFLARGDMQAWVLSLFFFGFLKSKPHHLNALKALSPVSRPLRVPCITPGPLSAPL